MRRPKGFSGHRRGRCPSSARLNLRFSRDDAGVVPYKYTCHIFSKGISKGPRPLAFIPAPTVAKPATEFLGVRGPQPPEVYSGSGDMRAGTDENRRFSFLSRFCDRILGCGKTAQAFFAEMAAAISAKKTSCDILSKRIAAMSFCAKIIAWI